MQIKRVVIFGSGGQLGVELVREFEARAYTVTGLDRSAVDISDGARVEHSLAELDPALEVPGKGPVEALLAELDSRP